MNMELIHLLAGFLAGGFSAVFLVCWIFWRIYRRHLELESKN